MSKIGVVSKHRILQKSNYHCFYCGEDLSKCKFEIDHIKPFSIYRDGSMKNLVATCVSCNRIKSNYTIEEFRQILMVKLGLPKLQFFFEYYGIELTEFGLVYKHTLNQKIFFHG